MNRKKFIEELAFLLQDIEDAEREEAMQYYEDYFDEAGPENEQQVINDLGSPERVAAIIKAGLDNQFDQDIEYSEKGMDNSNYKQSREIIDAKIISEEETSADDNNDYQNNKRHKNNFRGNSDRNRILLIFIIIGAVFLALPVGGGILGLGLGFFGAVFGLGVGILCGGAACLIGAIVCFVKAFMIIAAYPGAGLITMAAGCALIALAFVFFWLAKGLIKIIPAVIRGIVDFCQNIFNRVGDRR